MHLPAILHFSKSICNNTLTNTYCTVQLTRRFLAASLLNLTRYTWEFYYAICYLINYNPLTFAPQYIEVVDPVLYTWVTVSIFGLLMAIGFKKRNGLWSQQQQTYQPGIMANNSGGEAFAAVPGQGISPSPAYILYQQPAQPELSGQTAPPWRPELPDTGSPNANQQYYWTQHQQQSSYVQNLTPNVMEVADQPHRGLPGHVRPGAPFSGNILELSAQQQPQVTQVHEVAGTWNQKN
jgi:hypothetical protein